MRVTWVKEEREWRVRLRFGGDGPKTRCISLVVFRTNSAYLTLTLDEEEDLEFMAGWLLVLCVSFSGFLPYSVRQRAYMWAQNRADLLTARTGRKHWAHDIDPFGGRSIGVRIFDGTIWWSLWENEMGWSRDANGRWPWDSTGWTWNWHVQNWVLGKRRYEEQAYAKDQNAHFAMPEGRYPLEVTMKRVRWGRRLWWGRWQYRATLEFLDGIPIPGKGTAAHNCEDDAIFSITLPATDSPNVDLNEVRRDLEERRLKYGGAAWVPSKGWPARCERSA